MKALSDLQLNLVRVLWKRGPSTINDVHADVHERLGLASTTVGTVLNRLVKDDVLSRERVGRQFLYTPLLTEEEVRRSAVRTLMARLFDGSPRQLLSHLVREGEVTPEELTELEDLLEES